MLEDAPRWQRCWTRKSHTRSHRLAISACAFAIVAVSYRFATVAFNSPSGRSVESDKVAAPVLDGSLSRGATIRTLTVAGLSLPAVARAEEQDKARAAKLQKDMEDLQGQFMQANAAKNGKVENLQRGLNVQEVKDLKFKGMKLTSPKLVNFGAQAEIYSVQMPGKKELFAESSPETAVLKVSRNNQEYDVSTFQRECDTLKRLEAAGIPDIIRCLGEGEVMTAEGPRQGLLLTPFLDNARDLSVKQSQKQGRLPALSPVSKEQTRLETLFDVAVQVLEAGVACVDVQVLQQDFSGKLLWIDFTEAALLPDAPGGVVSAPKFIRPEYDKRYTSIKDAVIGYASEVFLLIPGQSRAIAGAVLTARLKKLAGAKKRGPGARFANVWGTLPWWGKGEPQRPEASELQKWAKSAAAAR